MTTPHAPSNTPAPAPGHDDPQLTAYALGELQGEQHAQARQAIEARLANDPALREHIAAIAQLGQQLETDYAATTSPGLDEAQRSALIMAASPMPATPALPAAQPSHQARNPLAKLLPYAAVAACAAGATAIGFLALQSANNTTAPGSILPEVVITNPPDAQHDITTDAITDAAPIEAPPLTPRERTALALETLVSVDYHETPLATVYNDIREKTGINVMVNWPGLELIAIDQDTLITLQLDNVSARTVLDYTMQLTGANAFDDDKPGYRVGEGVLEVATLRALRMQVVTYTYDIRPLLVQRTLTSQLRRELVAAAGFPQYSTSGGGGSGGLFGDDSGTASRQDLNQLALQNAVSRGSGLAPSQANSENTNAPRFDLNQALTDANTSDGQGGRFAPEDFMQESDVSRMEVIEQFFDIIQNTIGAPDEWLDDDSTISEINGQLVIKTTLENHDHIAQLLAQLAPQSLHETEADPTVFARLMAVQLEKALIEVEERRAMRERARLEQFALITDNPFKTAHEEPLSTFSVDVDTASYSIARRAILGDHRLPVADAVRIEEMVNYFDYQYAAPAVDHTLLDSGLLTQAALARIEAADASFTPFATHVDVADCPWAEGHRLVRIGIRGMGIDPDTRPPAHLVFLLDVSGSMSSADKLPLVKAAMQLLVDQLGDEDTVSIVIYAGGSGAVIEAMPARNKQQLKDAIENLTPGGGTAGAAGIRLAYQLAQRHYIAGGVNRVILCTDGDFNVGTSNTGQLVELVKQKANPPRIVNGDGQSLPGPAVYLSVMGVGTGNLNDEMMELITNAGNGNYAYLDSLQEATRVFAQQANSTLVTIAKDVKIQIEFNPAQVARYRLIGYENRILNDEDFNNDTVDAGDIGASHTVTALYEIIPPGHPDLAEDEQVVTNASVDALRYQQPRPLTDQAESGDLLTLKLRYKPVDADAVQGTSRLIEMQIPAHFTPFDEAHEDFRFAASVAAFGMVLRHSPHRGNVELSWIATTADAARQHDPHGYREQFVGIVEQARRILEPEAVEPEAID